MFLSIQSALDRLVLEHPPNASVLTSRARVMMLHFVSQYVFKFSTDIHLGSTIFILFHMFLRLGSQVLAQFCLLLGSRLTVLGQSLCFWGRVTILVMLRVCVCVSGIWVSGFLKHSPSSILELSPGFSIF